MGFLRWLVKASAPPRADPKSRPAPRSERWDGPSGRFAEDRHRPPGDWSIFSTTIAVAGLAMHRGAAEWFAGAARKAEAWGKPYGVRLVREPENAADRNAVAVWGEAGGDARKIGYLPREDAAEVVTELEAAGLPFAAELYSIYISDSGYIDVKILVLGPPGMGIKARMKRRTEKPATE